MSRPPRLDLLLLLRRLKRALPPLPRPSRAGILYAEPERAELEGGSAAAPARDDVWAGSGGGGGV